MIRINFQYVSLSAQKTVDTVQTLHFGGIIFGHQGMHFAVESQAQVAVNHHRVPCAMLAKGGFQGIMKFPIIQMQVFV